MLAESRVSSTDRTAKPEPVVLVATKTARIRVAGNPRWSEGRPTRFQFLRFRHSVPRHVIGGHVGHTAPVTRWNPRSSAFICGFFRIPSGPEGDALLTAGVL
jgi:hypothetical protein